MKTYATKKSDIQKKWYLIDARDQKLGRISTVIAHLLHGKHKPIFVPYLDVGDHVVVINAEKLDLSDKRLDQKVYYRHSGYPGGLKSVTARKLRSTYPERILFHAVRGMLPKNRLGRSMLKKLRVCVGPDHPYKAQKPETYRLSAQSRKQ